MIKVAINGSQIRKLEFGTLIPTRKRVLKNEVYIK